MVQTQVSTLDILPTVLGLLRLPAPDHIDGHSLLSDADEAADHEVLAETDYPLRFGWAPLRSVRSQGFKFIDAPRPELYDLRSDPAESGNAPDNFAANLLLGRMYVIQQKASDGIPLLQKAGTLRPDAIDPHRILADAYAQLGEDESASRERAEAERVQAAGGSRLGTSPPDSEEKP